MNTPGDESDGDDDVLRPNLRVVGKVTPIVPFDHEELHQRFHHDGHAVLPCGGRLRRPDDDDMYEMMEQHDEAATITCVIEMPIGVNRYLAVAEARSAGLIVRGLSFYVTLRPGALRSMEEPGQKAMQLAAAQKPTVALPVEKHLRPGAKARRIIPPAVA